MSWQARTFGCCLLASAALGSLAFHLQASDEDDAPPHEPVPVEQGCSFRADPDRFLQAQSRRRTQVYDVASRIGKSRRAAARGEQFAVSASTLPKRNFIDEEILGRLERENIPAAPLSSDQEFFRRIHLDLTGRIPSPADLRAFLEDASPTKRDDLIDRLLGAPEFTDKWAVWFMDLLGMTENPVSTARDPQIEGRNHFSRWIREQILYQRPIHEIATALVTGSGNNYFTENPAANFPVLASAPMGPAQDTYDMMLYRSATSFLGVAHYDCLLCHNGRGHLDGISLWGLKSTRSDAQRMAAHFARMRLNNYPNTTQYAHPLYNSTVVSDAPTGNYDLNTTSGNRPNRCAPDKIQGTRCTSFVAMQPEYRDGTTPAPGSNWRAAFAAKMVADPLFRINFANRIWKAFFNLGLVDPVDTLDPERLDPKNPPPSPWTLQASHPELLQKLATYFSENNTDLRVLIRTIVTSSSYQLSSQYDGEWRLDYVPLFARHYSRRLDAEEIHDAVVKATGVFTKYTWPTVNGQTVERGSTLPQSEPVEWAMQLPDINEPRANNGNARNFMAVFGRGNRDNAPRTRSGSILQQLTIMNDSFVINRTRVNASPLLQQVSRDSNNSKGVEDMYLAFLGRFPSADESATAVQYLAKARNPAERNAYIEDLAWVLVNKVEFLFSY